MGSNIFAECFTGVLWNLALIDGTWREVNGVRTAFSAKVGNQHRWGTSGRPAALQPMGTSHSFVPFCATSRLHELSSAASSSCSPAPNGSYLRRFNQAEGRF